jgi:hypothetical protein
MALLGQFTHRGTFDRDVFMPTADEVSKKRLPARHRYERTIDPKYQTDFLRINFPTAISANLSLSADPGTI